MRPLSLPLVILLCFALAAGGLTAAFITLSRQLEEVQESSAALHFHEVVARAATTTRADLQNELRPLLEASVALGSRWPLPENDLPAFLAGNKLLQKFKHAGAFLANGAPVGDGRATRFSSRDERLLARAWQGTPGIGGTEVDVEDGLLINTFAAPVLHQGKVVAVLFAALDSNRLSSIMEVPLFEQRSTSFVMDKTGQGVSLGLDKTLGKKNLFETLNRAALLSPTEAELRDKLHRGLAGRGMFSHRDTRYHVAFAPLGFNDWYSLAFLPVGAGEEGGQHTLHNLNLLAWGSGALFVALLGYALLLARRLHRQAERHHFRMETLIGCVPGGALRCCDDASFTILESNQGFLDLLGYTGEEIRTQHGNQFLQLVHPGDRPICANKQDIVQTGRRRNGDGRFTQEYRLVRKDGSRVWVTEFSQLVHDENGTHWCMVLLDTSSRHNALERRLVEEQRYRILFEMSEAILYEYDMRSGVLVTTRQFFEKFEYPLPDNLNSHHPVSMDIFHPEDMETFAQLHQALRDGEASTEALIRIFRNNGQWLWCHVQQTALHDANRKCIKALGKITDVDAETRVLYQLRDEVQRDPFTGLYNKIATAAQVDAALEQTAGEGEITGALCIVDLDNFKSINDHLGHETGDEVLKEFSTVLAGLFRATDIVGRVGGDEFIVFVRDIAQLSVLVRKLDLVREAARRTMPCPDGRVLHISASVGVALSPRDGTSFSVLYPRADKALYRSKEQKDVYSFYEPDMDVE